MDAGPLQGLHPRRRPIGISDDRSAPFDFAQGEDQLEAPSTAYLILSEVEGRTAQMQVPEAAYFTRDTRSIPKNIWVGLSW